MSALLARAVASRLFWPIVMLSNKAAFWNR